MPRHTFNASLFHLSLDAIEDLSRDDTYHAAISWTPYADGFLVQAESRAGDVWSSLPYHVRPIFKLAPVGTTHLFFHRDGAVLSLPTFDEIETLQAYKHPPFSSYCDDSFFAERGYEAMLDEHPRCDGSPLFFERETKRLAEVFRKLEGEMSDIEQLEQSLDDAHALACGVEFMKLESGLGPQWAGTDSAVEDLGNSLECIIGAFEELYSKSMLYTESILLATRARLSRSSRVAAEWQPEHRKVAAR